MGRPLPAALLALTLCASIASAAPQAPFADLFPLNAKVVVTREADLTGSWGGHYIPRFRVQDLTGDGRPELVREVAGGGAWQMLSVFQRMPEGGYRALLHDPGRSHLIWDANGDGLPEVLSRDRVFPDGFQRATESYRWLGDRYIAWHTARWYEMAEGAPDGRKAPVPNLVSLAVQEAASRSNRRFGMIVPVDSPAPAGQILNQWPKAGSTGGDDPRVHLAVAAGSTQFVPGPFPGVRRVTHIPKELQRQATPAEPPLAWLHGGGLHRGAGPLPPLPRVRSLQAYLKEAPELEACATLAPESWAAAVRLRSIRADGWPAPDPRPALQGGQPGASPYTPVPDHALITVLNGYVKAARRQGNDVWVDLAPAPGRVHRWPLPLKGFPKGSTPHLHVIGPFPGEASFHTPVPISQRHGPPPERR